MAAFSYRLCAFIRAQRASFPLIDTIANVFDLWTTHDSFSFFITISQAYSCVAYVSDCCSAHSYICHVFLSIVLQWSLFYSFPIHCLSVIRYRITYTVHTAYRMYFSTALNSEFISAHTSTCTIYSCYILRWYNRGNSPLFHIVSQMYYFDNELSYFAI